MSKNSEENTKKRGNPQNLIPWKPGQSGNPKGRRKGQRDYKTIYWEAMTKLAAANDLSPEELEEMMHGKAIMQVIRKGDYFMYKELNERVFGKVKEGVEVEFKGKTLADLIHAASHAARKTTKRKGADRPSN